MRAGTRLGRFEEQRRRVRLDFTRLDPPLLRLLLLEKLLPTTITLAKGDIGGLRCMADLKGRVGPAVADCPCAIHHLADRREPIVLSRRRLPSRGIANQLSARPHLNDRPVQLTKFERSLTPYTSALDPPLFCGFSQVYCRLGRGNRLIHQFVT